LTPWDEVYCYTQWGNLLKEREHAIIAGINLLIQTQMQQDLKEMSHTL